MKQKNTLRKHILLLTALIMIAVMIPVQAFAATGDFEIGRVATYSDKTRGEAGGMYFYEESGRKLCCAATEDGEGVVIAQLQNRDFDPVLCDGETIYYVNYVSDGTDSHVLPVICRSDIHGENQKEFTKTTGKRYEKISLLSLYNGKLYYTTQGKLKALTISSGSVKTLKKNFEGWNKLQIRARNGISATSRYVYGTYLMEPDKVYLYDCKTSKMKKFTAGEPIAIVSGKLYYLEHLEKQNAVLWRCDAKTGANKKKILKINNLLQIRNLTSKSMLYATSKDGKVSQYSYDFTTKTKTRITEEEYDNA